MSDVRRVLVVQTAFLGDVILTVPLIQHVKRGLPSADVDVILTPQAAPMLAGHPDVHEVLVFDKRGAESGLSGLFRKAKEVRSRKYDLAVVPHRSVRSALLVRLGGIGVRAGFHNSAGRFLFNRIARYEKSIHEIRRNLALLEPLGIRSSPVEYPRLYPSPGDEHAVDGVVPGTAAPAGTRMVGMAPGTVWNTKRWLKERFVELSGKLLASGYRVALIGGAGDVALCDEVVATVASPNIFSTAGRLSLLQSAALIRRCAVLVCNDSAPMHLAGAVGTPVVALFGATVPSFGFAPYGARDVVVETDGLDCRPCSIHGGEVCPIGTFDCMARISAERVMNSLKPVLTEMAGRG